MEQNQHTESDNKNNKNNKSGSYTTANEEKATWGLITAALAFIPILGSLGFLVAFIHEAGFVSIYHFPIEFVRLDTVLILEYVAITLLLLLFFGLTGTVLVLVTYKKQRTILKLLAYLNFIIVPAFLYASFKNYFGQYSSFILIGLLVLQLILIIPINWKKRDNVALTKKIKTKLSDWPIWVLYLLFVFGILAYVSGIMDGQFQRTYLSPSTNPDSVVLRIYGDEAICAPIVDNLTIKRSYFILKLDEPGLVLSTREFPNHLFIEIK